MYLFDQKSFYLHTVIASATILQRFTLFSQRGTIYDVFVFLFTFMLYEIMFMLQIGQIRRYEQCTYYDDTDMVSACCVIFASKGNAIYEHDTVGHKHNARRAHMICRNMGRGPVEVGSSIVVVLARFLNLTIDGRYKDLFI